MISYVIFDVTSRLSFPKFKISEFWHYYRVPRVKICIQTNFQLNQIICWHSNIWMKLWDILWYLKSYLTSQSRLSLPKFKILEFWHYHRVLGWKYESTHIFSSIRSFVGILTSCEWNFGTFYIWRHIWRHNHVLAF